MKIGIMQPYFFPYIGYWQLMEIVDKYVIYDDVNYIKGGWINRNRILVEGKIKYFNVRLIGSSSYKKINEIRVNDDKNIVRKELRIIQAAYKKAPFYEEVYPIIETILSYKENNLAYYLGNSLKNICDYLDITTEIFYSSSLKMNGNLKGEEKILAICELLGATEYYNAIGGQDLYSYNNFNNKGIKLKFLKTDEITYKQFGEEFYPNLSIIDVMMFNSKEDIKRMLKKHTFITEDS